MAAVGDSSLIKAEKRPSSKSHDVFRVRPKFTDIKSLMRSYSCPLCKDIVLQPQQTICGYRVCQLCIDEKFGSETVITCPMSHDDLDEDEEAPCLQDGGLHRDQVIPDPGTEKDLLKEKCFCINEPFGCSKEIIWKDLKKHLLECKHTAERCLNERCRKRCTEQGQLEHVENCLDALILCSLCSQPIKHRDLKDHERICQLENCKLCKKRCGSLDKLLLHRRTHAPCVSKAGKCYYYKYCKFESSTVEELKSHMEKEKDLHIEMLTAEVDQLEMNLE